MQVFGFYIANLTWYVDKKFCHLFDRKINTILQYECNNNPKTSKQTNKKPEIQYSRLETKMSSLDSTFSEDEIVQVLG